MTELEKKVDLLLAEQKKMMELVKQNRSFFQKLCKRFEPKLGVFDQYPPKLIEISKYYQIPENYSGELPGISIVTPSFNQGHFIKETIESVLEQHYPKLEYIIQDGGSKDKTVDILKHYENKLTYWESVPDKGQSNAINLGFAHAHGDIMAYLNSDDLLLPGTLHYVSQYFQEHPEVDAVYGHRVIIDEYSQETGRWVLPPHSDEVTKWVDYIPQETLFWRRSLWEKVNSQVDESFQFAMDWDLILRFIDANAKMVRLPRFLGAFRVHSSQKTSGEMSNIGNEEMAYLRKRCHGRFVEKNEISRYIRLYFWQHVILHKAYRLGLIKY